MGDSGTAASTSSDWQMGRTLRPTEDSMSSCRARSEFVKKIYVGNLPWSTTDDDLKELFATYGAVESSAVVNDRETGRSRGFGFVEMGPADADKAIGELDGRDYGNRALRVNEALDKRSGGGGGGGGGAGGGRW
jgi:RNA recognition motif-containing protein